MRLVDTFLFSEPHEADVLWVKLNVEDRLVAEWIVVENSYTHQGEYKGHYLNTLLREDARFARFLSKLHVIECEVGPAFELGRKEVFDADAVQIERAQREAAVPHILANYSDDDYVLISDVDECLDTDAPRRRRLLQNKLTAGGDLILVPRIRYWFDYDNRGLGRRCVPLVSIRQLRRDGRPNHYREQWLGTPVVWRHEMIFEYSYCYPRDKIMRKFDTFIHTGFQQSELDSALRYNHRPTSQRRARQLSWNFEDWFVNRTLNSRNSPAFVRQHLAELKTNVVSTSYQQSRLDEYPQFFPRRRVMRYYKLASLYGQMHSANARQALKGRIRSWEAKKSDRRRAA
jgi:hypothetical protein